MKHFPFSHLGFFAAAALLVVATRGRSAIRPGTSRWSQGGRIAHPRIRFFFFAQSLGRVRNRLETRPDLVNEDIPALGRCQDEGHDPHPASALRAPDLSAVRIRVQALVRDGDLAAIGDMGRDASDELQIVHRFKLCARVIKTGRKFKYLAE